MTAFINYFVFFVNFNKLGVGDAKNRLEGVQKWGMAQTWSCGKELRAFQ